MQSISIRPSDLHAATELGRACGVSASTAQVLINRGISEAPQAQAFLEPRLASVSSPQGMADLTAATDRLAAAIRGAERIAIFGDYDVDGTTSATILGEILVTLGGNVVIELANRFDGGYGLGEAALDRVLAHRPHLLVTCDCGSSDHDRIERAHRSGTDVIVVDHHLVPESKLPALAFLNPHRPDCAFPYKGLASAGLAFVVGAALRRKLGAHLDLRPWLDLVALGTVADVAPLDGDNRRLVRAGLKLLSSPSARPGLIALREACRISAGSWVGGTDIAFRFAPRLNAAGRLGDPRLTLELLQAPTLQEARLLAAKVERVNNERKQLQREIEQEAVEQIRTIYPEQGSRAAGVVAASDQWHRGVVGIVAARLAECFGVPALVVSIEAGVGHGSGRAPDGFQLYDAVSQCQGLLNAFGGHQAAVGFNVDQNKIDLLRADFEEACQQLTQSNSPHNTAYEIDVAIDDSQFFVPPALELALLEPVGEGNREPLFLLRDVRVGSVKVVAEQHLSLAFELGARRISAFAMGMADRQIQVGSKLQAVGSLRPDSWRGGSEIQMDIRSLD